MTRLIEMDGQPFAMLIERPGGSSYLVPPIVVDSDGEVIEGHEVLAAMRQAGVTIDETAGGFIRGHTSGGALVEQPMLTGRTTGDLAAIDQQMADLSRQLGVPIGPPE